MPRIPLGHVATNRNNYIGMSYLGGNCCSYPLPYDSWEQETKDYYNAAIAGMMPITTLMGSALDIITKAAKVKFITKTYFFPISTDAAGFQSNLLIGQKLLSLEYAGSVVMPDALQYNPTTYNLDALNPTTGYLTYPVFGGNSYFVKVEGPESISDIASGFPYNLPITF